MLDFYNQMEVTKTLCFSRQDGLHVLSSNMGLGSVICFGQGGTADSLINKKKLKNIHSR
jgi:hypothetical protein